MSQETHNHMTQSGRFHAKARRRSYWLATLLLAAALGIGCVIGVAGTMLYMKKKPKPPQPEEWIDSVLKIMDDSVGLQPKERDEIRAIALSSMERSRENRRKEFDSMRDDVDAVLGPDRIEKWNHEVERRWGRKRRGGPDAERGSEPRRHHRK